MILGARITVIYSCRFIIYSTSIFRGPSLVIKRDIDLLTLRAVLTLFLPSIITGKLLWYYVVEYTRVPLSPAVSKGGLLALVVLFSPFLF